MLRKVSLVLSFISVLGLGLAIALPSTALAKDPKPQQQQKPKQPQKQVVVKPQQKNVVVKNKTVVVKKKYIIGNKYNGHIWYGYSRHRWRGVWYAYGVGPCWIYIDGVWFWNVLACPE